MRMLLLGSVELRLIHLPVMLVQVVLVHSRRVLAERPRELVGLLAGLAGPILSQPVLAVRRQEPPLLVLAVLRAW